MELGPVSSISFLSHLVLWEVARSEHVRLSERLSYDDDASSHLAAYSPIDA